MTKHPQIWYTVLRGNTMSLKAISIRLSDEQIEKGKKLAQDEGTTLSQKARWLITHSSAVVVWKKNRLED